MNHFTVQTQKCDQMYRVQYSCQYPGRDLTLEHQKGYVLLVLVIILHKQGITQQKKAKNTLKPIN